MMTVENIELNPSIVDKFYLQDIRVGYWIWKSPNYTSSEKTRLRSSNNFQFDISSKSNGLGLHPLFITFMPRF